MQSSNWIYEVRSRDRGFLRRELCFRNGSIIATGYTQYAIGAFKNLAIAEVEEITLKFKLKISAEGGIPMIASGKTESDFEIEVKCKFPDNKTPQSPGDSSPSSSAN